MRYVVNYTNNPIHTTPSSPSPFPYSPSTPSSLIQVDWNTESGLPEVTAPLSAADCDWAWYTEKEIDNSKV